MAVLEAFCAKKNSDEYGLDVYIGL